MPTCPSPPGTLSEYGEIATHRRQRRQLQVAIAKRSYNQEYSVSIFFNADLKAISTPNQYLGKLKSSQSTL